MNEGKIAVRYARAIYSLAKEENKLTEIKNDLQNIGDIISGSQEFKNFLKDPVIKKSKKKELFKTIFTNQVNKSTLLFLDLVVENRRERYLNDIIRLFLGLYNSEFGIKSATITTAATLNKETKKAITDLINNKLKIKEMELKEKVDEKIIGGFILKIEDTQIDASVSNMLKKVKKELINR